MSDSERIDWLEKHRESVITVWETAPNFNTGSGLHNQSRQDNWRFVGWTTGNRKDELPTLREAIDVAITECRT